MKLCPDSEEFDSYPCVSRLGNGELLVVFSRGLRGGPGVFRIAGVRSIDGGATWSAPVTLIDTPRMHDYDSSILAWDDKVLVISTTVPLTHSEKVTTSQFLAIRSEDNGRTWSEPIEIEHPYVYCSGKINPGVRFADGTLAFGFSWDAHLQRGKAVFRDGDSWNEAGVMISTDGGRTWTPGETLAIRESRSDDRPGAINGLDEPALAVCEDGALYTLMRSGFDRLYEARSTDRGRTWDTPRRTALVSHNAPADLCVFEHPRLGRGWLATYDHSPVNRFPLVAAISLDEGKSWSPPKAIADHPMQCSYPGCVQTPDGGVLIVWQQQTKSGRHIEAAIVTLDEIEGMGGRSQG